MKTPTLADFDAALPLAEVDRQVEAARRWNAAILGRPERPPRRDAGRRRQDAGLYRTKQDREHTRR